MPNLIKLEEKSIKAFFWKNSLNLKAMLLYIGHCPHHKSGLVTITASILFLTHVDLLFHVRSFFLTPHTSELWVKHNSTTYQSHSLMIALEQQKQTKTSNKIKIIQYFTNFHVSLKGSEKSLDIMKSSFPLISWLFYLMRFLLTRVN